MPIPQPLYPLPHPSRRLLDAIEAGDVASAKAAFDLGAQAHTPILDNGHTALHRLATVAPLLPEPLVKLLMLYGAKADQLSEGARFQTPHTALAEHLYGTKHRSAAFVHALLEAGADANEELSSVDMERPLHVTMSIPYFSPARVGIVRTLIEHGADVNALDHEGYSPLHVLMRSMAYGSDREILVLMLKAGADPHLARRRATTGGVDNVVTPFSLAMEREKELARNAHKRDGGAIALAASLREWTESKTLDTDGTSDEPKDDGGKVSSHLRMQRRRY